MDQVEEEEAKREELAQWHNQNPHPNGRACPQPHRV